MAAAACDALRYDVHSTPSLAVLLPHPGKRLAACIPALISNSVASRQNQGKYMFIMIISSAAWLDLTGKRAN